MVLFVYNFEIKPEEFLCLSHGFSVITIGLYTES